MKNMRNTESENEIKTISQRTGFSVSEIKEFNELNKFTMIELNDVLRVYANCGAFNLTKIIKEQKDIANGKTN